MRPFLGFAALALAVSGPLAASSIAAGQPSTSTREPS
jgi:hypothetical protein